VEGYRKVTEKKGKFNDFRQWGDGWQWGLPNYVAMDIAISFCRDLS
jgi:hypothetical protein